MKKRILFLAVAALFAAPSGLRAQAQGPPTQCGQVGTTAIDPFAWIFINGECTDLSHHIKSVQRGKIWSIDTPLLELTGANVQLTALYNGDPFITFGATTTSLFAGPTTFAFLFGTPIVPGLYSTATSSGGVSITNGAGGSASVATSFVYPTFISGYGTVGFFPSNLGVDIGTATCTAAGPPATVTTVCNQGSAANTFTPVFYDGLEALLTYSQTDIGSIASWSGAVTLNATVPEPSSLALMASALVLLGGFAARRRPNKRV